MRASVPNDLWNRDFALCDQALENMYRRGVEACGTTEGDATAMLALSLRNAALSLHSEEFDDVRDAWCACLEFDDPLIRAATAERVALVVAAMADRVSQTTQRHAEAFVEQGNDEINEAYILSFGEEVARGMTGLFTSGALVSRVRKEMRVPGTADVISKGGSGSGSGVAIGRAGRVASLNDVGGNEEIVWVDAVKGSDDIPEGVKAVLTPSSIDLLSHVAIRARGLGCLLVAEVGDEQAEMFQSSASSNVVVEVRVDEGDHVKVVKAATGAASTTASTKPAVKKPGDVDAKKTTTTAAAAAPKKKKAANAAATGPWTLSYAECLASKTPVCGTKTLNVARLAAAGDAGGTFQVR